MNSEYIYVWQPVQSGIYSSKSGYNDATVTNKPRALNADQYFNWIANIWAGDFSSKAISFLMVSVWEITPLHCAVYIAADDTIKSILFKHRKLICLPPSGVSSPILPWIC
ncbi:hypothetical protein F2Q69_00050160 [Brassica cretica]|uniref:Uncharacterized protein n=1 Tax=Brassica cretica TaxID=69181 RepID=A0A8S9PPW2_BRACR|nr:hypothetical protein F2Q69_00050160 [Brassica cretica]